MKKNIIIVIMFFILFVSCSQKPEIELEILNNTLLSKGYDNMPTNSKITDKGLNIIRYRIINNSDKPYYFNRAFFYSGVVQKEYQGGKLDFFQNTFFLDENNKMAVSSNRFVHFNDENFDCLQKKFNREQKILNCFKYDSKKRNTFFEKLNFVIYPGDSKYFEYILHLPFDETGIDNSRFIFEKNKKYFMKIEVFSDSTNLENWLTWPEMVEIKKNRYKVFHGKITSKNKVPVKFIDCN